MGLDFPEPELVGTKSSNFGRRELTYPSMVTQNHSVIPAMVLEKFRFERVSL